MLLSLITKFQILMYDEGSFTNDILRSIGAGIDSMIFSLISIVMNLLIDVSQVRLDADIIKTFSSRVFAILGILMFFKLSMSLLNVIVNPDALSDKQKGLSKISMRVVVMIIMLIMVNPIFDFAIYRLQPAVIETIPMIVLGTNQNLNTATDNPEDSAIENIAATTFKAFVTKNADSCSDDRLHVMYDETNTIKGIADLIDQRCDKDHSVYAFNYAAIISAIAGLIMAVVLVIYTLDVAIRAIKLVILQLLAPIPIVSYADPKTSQKSFSEWVKMCVSAYIDLFIKLAIIYFVIFLLSQLVSSKGFVDSNGQPINGLVFVAIVIGIFLFASQAPAYISKIFGITPDKNGSFLGKALGVAGAALGGFAGSAVGAGLGALTGGVGALSQEVQNNGWGGAKTALLGGMAGGAASGLKGGMKSANQYRNMANQKARAISGKSNLDTSFKGRTVDFLNNVAKNADKASVARFDETSQAVQSSVLAGYSSEIEAEQQALSDAAVKEHNSKISEYDQQYKTYENQAVGLLDKNYQPINDVAAVRLNEINQKMSEVQAKRQEEVTKAQLAKNLEQYRKQAEKNVVANHKELRDNVYFASKNNREQSEQYNKEVKKLSAALKESGLADKLKK